MFVETLSQVRRDYRVALSSDSRLDDQGFLRTTAKFARAGVQEYLDAEGNIIREFRPPAEVAKSVSTLSLQVITLDHTAVPVDIDNRKNTDIGSTGEATYEDGWAGGQVVIRDRHAIYKAQTTHKELSVGYHADIDWTPGVFIDVYGWQGPKMGVYVYDCVQRNIRANHIALVPRARAGAKARLDGKPCGAGHISEEKECHIGSGAPTFEGVPSSKEFSDRWRDYVESSRDAVERQEGEDEDDWYERVEAEEARRTQELVALLPDWALSDIASEIENNEYDVIAPFAHTILYDVDDIEDALPSIATHDACSCDSTSRSEKEGRNMPKLNIGDKEFDVPKEVADTFAKLRKRGDDAQQRVDSLETELTDANTKVTMLEQQATKVDAEKEREDAIAKAVQERLDAYEAAKPYLMDAEFNANHTPEQWMKDALETTYPEMNLDGLNIPTAFQMLTQQSPPERSYNDEFVTQVHSDRQLTASQARTLKADEQILADAQQNYGKSRRDEWNKKFAGV